MKIKTVALIAGFLSLGALGAHAQQPKVDDARVHAVLGAGFKMAPADWAGRLVQDETMKVCSAARNTPTPAQGAAIMKRERSSIVYPADGKLMGDWQKGAKLAQSGYGMRFSDYPPRRENGGNCYACHQLAKSEVSYGTVGPSLLEYGKIRKFAAADVKAVYDKIYNSHAAFPCSLMPRLGANKVLGVEQIKDLVAYVMSPDSPVNK